MTQSVKQLEVKVEDIKNLMASITHLDGKRNKLPCKPNKSMQLTLMYRYYECDNRNSDNHH